MTGRQLVTIGVYGCDLDSFLAALAETDVRLLADVRQRRGVRGPRYAWANSRRLQAALADAGIAYSHHPELAPTTELRHLQYREDDRRGESKRSRTRLAPEYTRRYTEEILQPADLEPLLAQMPAGAATALLCVEASPEACHRSLVAQRLRREHGLAVVHLRPDGRDPPSPLGA